MGSRNLRACGGTIAGVLGLLLSGSASPRLDAQATQPPAQGAPSPASRLSGTVKAVTEHDFVLTDASGQDHAITLPAGAKVLIVPPGSKDLSAATPGAVGDLQPGDRVLVSGKAGDAGTGLAAIRVVVMKGSAIAESHASDEAAWAAGTGGIVKSVDLAANSIVLSSAARTITIVTTPATVFRRYAGGSVRFEDATRSTLSSVGPGDQLRARGTRSADGSTLTAEEIVTGSFSNFSGQIASIDAASGMVTLKDLATKRSVTVAVTAQSNVRRLPAEVAARFAARERAGSASGAGSAGNTGASSTGSRPAGAGATASGTAGATASPAGTTPRWQRGQGGPEGPGAAGGGTRGGGDLSAMISRLPTESLGGLKVGEAVMIVASSAEGASGRPTAISLLAGVEPILAAAPAGEAMTLSPWSVGGGGGEGGEGASPQ